MYLQKLDINGFKSFAHKTSLEFKPGITAIVGPNGSGKSNVADAVRWVLGEQSLKMLRGKKSEDVIFSGSDKKARLGMAEVSLYFNNDPDKNNIGMSEICISRRLYRNGDSEYLINKQKTRLLDVQMILAKAGMAHSSYSIIGQGMIDAFLLASSQDRKEFFEEASGVKPLQIKRGQSLNKLEHTEENLETALIQLQEITPRLNSLTRQVKKLERRAEVETKLKQAQKKYYSAVWHEIEKDWKTKHNELKKIASEQDEMTKKVDELQNEMAKLTKDSAKSEDFEKLQEKYQQKLEEKMKLNEKLTALKIQSAQVVTSKKENIPYEVGQQALKALKSLKSLKIKMTQALDGGNLDEIKKLFKEQDSLINKIDEVLQPYVEKDKDESQQDGKNDEVAKLERDIAETDNQISQIQSDIKKESQKEKQERSHIWELQQKYQTQQQELNSISNSVNNLRVELARLETKKDDLEQEIRQELNELDQVCEYKTDGRRHSGMSPSNKIAEDWLINGGRRHVDVSPSRVMNENEKRESITEIGKLKRQIELIGGIDPEVQKEYEEIKTRHEFLSSQTDDLKKSIDSLEELILELDENIKKQFEASFKIINQEFQKHFKILFAGGRSKLILVKEEDDGRRPSGMSPSRVMSENENVELENMVDEESEVQKIKDRLKSNVYAGVDIEATPPGKKLKSINMLSGGERALTSIALLCAIISANPSPFIVLDEVDAALDEANSIRFAEIIEDLSRKSQFILITHNRATMEKSDILYGVTMGNDGVSTLLSLKLESAEKYTNR